MYMLCTYRYRYIWYNNAVELVAYMQNTYYIVIIIIHIGRYTYARIYKIITYNIERNKLYKIRSNRNNRNNAVVIEDRPRAPRHNTNRVYINNYMEIYNTSMQILKFYQEKPVDQIHSLYPNVKHIKKNDSGVCRNVEHICTRVNWEMTEKGKL